MKHYSVVAAIIMHGNKIMPVEDGGKVNNVKITFSMDEPVEESMYEYLTAKAN